MVVVQAANRVNSFFNVQLMAKLVMGVLYSIYTSGVLEHKWRASLKLHYC